MHEYYNIDLEREIDLEKDVCGFSKWNEGYKSFYCCRHDKGFLIFLKPEELKVSDEYLVSDPYSVSDNINSEFQKRRFNCTLELIKQINSNKTLKILDIGCGEGHLTNKIKQVFPKYEIAGIDYSVSAINNAVSSYPDINFAVADAYKPPYPSKNFDLVICNNIWEHVPDPLSLLNSINRILKDNAHLIISTPSRYRLGNIFRILLGKRIMFMSSHHVTEYSVGQVIEQLNYGGYSIVNSMAPIISSKKKYITLIKRILQKFIEIIGSHHTLESTVFYLAKKNQN